MMESEVFAAQLQLQELRAQLQLRSDTKTAMSVYLQQSRDDHEQIGDQQHDSMDCSIPLDDMEICQLQEQMAALTLFIDDCESQKVATSLQAREEANDAALQSSLEVADRIAQQESWHKRIIDHDADFARSLAFCDSEEWEDNGDNLERPLQLGPRPSSPELNNIHSGLAVRAVADDSDPQPCAQPGYCYTSGVALLSGMPEPNTSTSSLHADTPLPDFHCTSGVATMSSMPEPKISTTSLHAASPHAPNFFFTSGVAIASSMPEPNISTSSLHAASPHAPDFFFTSGVAITGSMPEPNTSSSSFHAASPHIPDWLQAYNNSNNSSGSGQVFSDKGKGKRPMLAVSGMYNNTHDSSSNRSEATSQLIQCNICFDDFPLSSILSAELPQQLASSSSSKGRCGHYFCRGCMKSYVQEQIKAHRYPICCPMPSCSEEMSHDDITSLLKENTKELQVFDMLVMEHSIDASLRVYCPFKDCSCLLERPDDLDLDDHAGQADPFECPSCHRVFCLHCGTAGWHLGMTCQQFQALPPELRSVEDAAMLRMAAAQAWKRCPGCGVFVERIHGCNHMSCRCGVNFCYACGQRYRSTEPTADNVHGTPGCACPLFAVPEEDPVVVPPPAAVVLRPARPRPVRGGRKVSRTRCRHSASIHHCPMGPGRCWFWHDEDEDEDDAFERVFAL